MDTLDTAAEHCGWESPSAEEGVRRDHSRCRVGLAGDRDDCLNLAWEMHEAKPMDGEGAYRSGREMRSYCQPFC